MCDSQPIIIVDGGTRKRPFNRSHDRAAIFNRPMCVRVQFAFDVTGQINQAGRDTFGWEGGNGGEGGKMLQHARRNVYRNHQLILQNSCAHKQCTISETAPPQTFIFGAPARAIESKYLFSTFIQRERTLLHSFMCVRACAPS